MEPVDFFVFQSSIGRTINNPERNALLAGGNRFSAEDIEEMNAFDPFFVHLLHAVQNSAGFDAEIDNKGHVTGD